MDECLDKHKQCPGREEPLLPARIIDIGSHDDNSMIALCITKVNDHAHYAALSYCWGVSQQVTSTTSTNLLDRVRGIEFQILPKTVQDAIITTRKLKLRFLWIDALCILQDSEEDKATQSALWG
jgi:hypothetical protein